MEMSSFDVSNNEIGILLYQSEAGKINKAIKPIISINSLYKLATNRHNYSYIVSYNFPIICLTIPISMDDLYLFVFIFVAQVTVVWGSRIGRSLIMLARDVRFMCS